MNIKLTSIVIITFCILNICCWKKQQHDILAPKTPVYQVTGTVIGSCYHQPIQSAVVSISGTVTYIGDDTSTAILLVDTTTTIGRFEFNNIPGANNYTLEVKKQGYETLYVPIMTYYEAKEVEDVILGMYLIEEKEYTFPNLYITGITFANEKLWLTSLKKELVELGDNLSILSLTVLHQFFPVALTWDGENFWSADTIRHTLYQFQFTNSGDIQYLNQHAIPMNPFNMEQPIDLIDMCWSEGMIWGCSPIISRKYCQFIPGNDESLNLYVGPEEKYYSVGIAADTDTIYLSCYYNISNRLYLLDKNTQEELAYLVIPEGAGLITWDGSAIWWSKEHKIIKYTF